MTSRFDTGWTKTPSSPGYAWSTRTCHQSSKGMETIRPPSRSIASRLARGAESGTTTVQGTPTRRAFQATPCAMLPALAVQTPRARAFSSARARALPEPRILNEPIGWRFSSFRKICDGPSTSSRTSGVRMAMPVIRDAAARISARPIGSIGVVASASERDRLTETRSAANLRVDVLRRGDVLDREAHGLENRDVGRRGPSRHRARDELAHVADDVRVVDGSFLARQQEIAGLHQSRLAVIHEEAGSRDGRRVELPRGGDAGADRVDVNARGE